DGGLEGRGAGLVLVFLDAHLLDTPVAQAGAVDPVVEELLPGAAGVALQFAAEVGHAQDAVAVAALPDAGEVQKGRLGPWLLDPPDDAGALGVAHAEEVDDVAELGDLLHHRAVLAAADGAEQAVAAVVLAADVRQPLQPAREAQEFVVLAAALLGD